MERGRTSGSVRGLAIALLPAIIVVVGLVMLRADPASSRSAAPADVLSGSLVDEAGPDGQVAPESERPSGPAAEVGPPPSVGEAREISGALEPVFRIPPAEPEEVVRAAMQQEAARGETPIDPIDRLAAEPADTGSQQEDPAAAGSDEEPAAGALQRNFAGVTDTGWIPPDDQIAAGPNHLVVPLNGAVAYFDKGGNNLWQTTLTGFFGSLANPVSSVFDPRIIWDHDSGRFFLVALGKNTTTHVSFYFIAVSATSNPFHGWCMYRHDAQAGNANVWADYPDLGVGPDGGFFITSNQFTWAGAFAGAQLFTYDKSDLTSCSGGTLWINGPFTDGDGGLSFTLRPAVEHDNLHNSQAEWIVNSNSTDADWLSIWRVRTNFPAGPTITSQTLSVTSYQTPPDARQPGGVQALDNIGTRLLNAVSRWDWLWTVGTDECSWGGSCLRWYQLDLYNWPTIVIDHQSSYGATNLDYFYPGITSNDSNDVVISFARSGTGEWAQARHTARLNSDAANSLQGSALLHAGEERYLNLDSKGRNRWGDYAGVSYGANDEFWILHQYADDPYPPGHWDTWIGCIGLDESQCAALTPTPTPTPIPAPNRFYGDVTLHGSPAAPGTAVSGRIGGTTCGSTTVQAGSTYVLDVPSAGAVPGCGTPGATVNFVVGGYLANETGSWTSGAFTPLDLTAGATPTPTNTPVTPSPTPTPKPAVEAECTHWTTPGEYPQVEVAIICHLSDEKYHGEIFDWEILLEEQRPAWPRPVDWKCTAEEGVEPWTPNYDISPNPKCKDETGKNPWLVSQCRDMHVLLSQDLYPERVQIHLTDMEQQNIGIMWSYEDKLPPPACAATPTPTNTPVAAPNRFYGDVTLNGSPAAPGTSVNGRIGGTTCGSTTVQAGSTYVLDVPSAGSVPGCGTPGATVNFVVGGYLANETGTWTSGAFTPLDLTAGALPTPTPVPVCTPPFTPIVAGDSDCDAAPDAAELGLDPVLCGTRDPNNPWDFYDVPVPTLHVGGDMNNRNGAVTLIDDVLGVIEYSGTIDGGPPTSAGRDYDDDIDGDGVDDGVAYDRSVGAAWPELGPGKSHSGPPDGAVTLFDDVLLVIDQSGHGPCPGP